MRSSKLRLIAFTSTSPPPLRTGRVITLDFHQVEAGDVILWNYKWFLVSRVTRTPDAKNPINQVRLEIRVLPSEGGSYGSVATGEECSPILCVPRAWVDHDRLPDGESS